MQFDIWTLLGVALVAFVAGRLTAKDPVQRERERLAHEADIDRLRATMKPELRARAIDLRNDGKLINAVKLIRTDMAIGLKDAKDLVEKL